MTIWTCDNCGAEMDDVLLWKETADGIFCLDCQQVSLEKEL